MPVIHTKRLIAERAEAIARFHEQTGLGRAELDVSGGVDSACMLGLLAKALGSEAVTAVYSDVHSSRESRQRAEATAAAFSVDLVVIELSSWFDELIDRMRRSLAAAGYDQGEIDARCAADPTILGSIRSTLRGPVGRGFNRLTGGGIRHGTGNECEDRFLRFYQKGGDGEVDTNPIAMLSKGEVFQLARALKVPRDVLAAKPSPDLWGVGEGHSDEDELESWTGVPFTYSRIDLDTGAYIEVGTIERVSRFLDECEDRLFTASDEQLEEVLEAALSSRCFRGLEPDLIARLCRAARRVERATRHKLNPSAVALGERATLLEAGLITDGLPVRY